jgi:hypothetical protein
MRWYGFAWRLLLLLGMTACSHSAMALEEDFDAHLYVVESYLGSQFNLRKVDGDGNGILDEDQLGLLSVVLEGGAVASGLNGSMVSAVLAGFNANLPKVEQELTVTIGSQGTVNLVSQLAQTDPVLSNAMLKLITGFVTMGDTLSYTYINNLADQVIVKVLTGTPEASSIPSVQNQLNFVASAFTNFGNAGAGPNYLGAQGDVDGDTIPNLTEYTTASGDRENWLKAQNIPNPPLRLKDLSGGGLAISGINMTFSLDTAGGAGNTTYQWRKGTYASSTLVTSEPTFNIPFLNQSDSGRYFATYSDGVRTRNTPLINLTVTRVNIFISRQIAGATRNVGSSYTFTVEAQGGSPGPYTYTWKKNNTAIPGAPNSNTYTINNLQVSDAGQYSVTVSSNGGGDGATSGPVQLNVNSNIPPISIVTHPKSALRPEGASHTFSVEVTGGSGAYNYEWRKGGVAIGGAPNQPTLLIPVVDIGTYSVFVSDAADQSRTALSNSATLAITTNPVVVTTHPESRTLAIGESYTLSVEVSGGSGSYNYEWRKNGVPVNGAPNSPTFLLSGVNATAKGNYTVFVSDTNEEGNAVESNAAEIDVLAVVVIFITQQPESVTKAIGSSHTFTVTAAGGTGSYNYAWKFNGEYIDAPNQNTLTINNIQVAHAGDYSVEVRDVFQPILMKESDVATLSLELASLIITQQPQGATKALGQSHTFTVAATGGSGQYSYEWRKNGSPIGVTTPTLQLINLTANDSGVYTCFVEDTQIEGDALSDEAVLEVLNAPPLVVNTQPQGAFKYTGDQHTLRVVVSGGTGTYNYSWLKDGDPLCGNEPACNTNELTFGALATSDDGSYSCVVTDANFPLLTVTTVSVPLGVEPHLTLMETPRGRRLLAGDTLELSVDAVGGYPPVSYQWRLNGQPIPDALDAPVYTPGPVRLAMQGEYTCVVSDGFADTLETQPAFVQVELVDIPESSEISNVNFSVDLTLPPSGSLSQGQALGTITRNENGSATMNLTVNQGIGAARGPSLTLNIGAPGINGPVLFEIPMAPSVSFVQQVIDLTAEEASIILSGRAYLTVNTTAFPNGELRAQLFPLVNLVIRHDADTNDPPFVLDLSELLRVIQFYNLDGYHCDETTPDGYAPGRDVTLENCQPHSADYNPGNGDTEWVISLSEVLRVIQIFNAEGRQYHACDTGEDGFCPGPAPSGQGEAEGEDN